MFPRYGSKAIRFDIKHLYLWPISLALNYGDIYGYTYIVKAFSVLLLSFSYNLLSTKVLTSSFNVIKFINLFYYIAFNILRTAFLSKFKNTFKRNFVLAFSIRSDLFSKNVTHVLVWYSYVCVVYVYLCIHVYFCPHAHVCGSQKLMFGAFLGCFPPLFFDRVSHWVLTH